MSSKNKNKAFNNQPLRRRIVFAWRILRGKFQPMQLFNGDCLEVMKSIPDKSVDMILTDPPYGTTACKWDSVIPFAPMWEQLNRIIKDNGAICLFEIGRAHV